MPIDTLGILTLIGVTILLGYIGSFVFTKTKIPDVVWLLIFGLIVGPVLGLFESSIFIIVAPLVGALALIIILFEAGLNMDFYRMIREFPRSTAMAVLGIILSILVVGFLSTILFGFDLLRGMLLGAIIGGTSSPIVLSIVGKLSLREEVKTVLELESILTDPLCIVVAIALIGIIVSKLPVSTITPSVLSAFCIGAIIGLLVGLIWLFTLYKLEKRQFKYILTLSVLLLMYVFVESVTGSGAIAALFFGLILGNGRTFSKMLRLGRIYKIKKSLIKFHEEITFFVKAFFFVFLGLILTINPKFIIYGIFIATVLVLLRFFVVEVTKVGMGLSKVELNMIRVMAPRGLAAAVLAGFPLVYGIADSNIFLNVAFVVILATVIYTTVSTKIFYKAPAVEVKEEKKKKKL